MKNNLSSISLIILFLFSCRTDNKKDDSIRINESIAEESNGFVNNQDTLEKAALNNFKVKDLEGIWGVFKDETENANFIISNDSILYFESTEKVPISINQDSLQIANAFGTISFFISFVSKDSMILINEFNERIVYYPK